MKWADYKAARDAEQGVTDPSKGRKGRAPQHGKKTLALSGCACDPCEAWRERTREYARQQREANPGRQQEYDRQRREANPERNRQWYEANREHAVEYARQRREANPERHREIARRSREANPERVREASRKYREANPERAQEVHRRRRARKAGVPHEPYTLAGIALRDDYTCQLCELPVDMSLSGRYDPMGPHLDHIHPISKGGPDTPANIQLTHGRCNLIKYDRTDVDKSRYELPTKAANEVAT